MPLLTYHIAHRMDIMINLPTSKLLKFLLQWIYNSAHLHKKQLAGILHMSEP